MTPKIEIRNLRKAFGPKEVLKDVNLTVHEGESVVVIGGSGTGKSVLLKCILGIIIPDAGEILIDGVNILKAPGRERQAKLRQVGMLFQGAALFDSLPIWENISFGNMQGEGMPRSEARDHAVTMLAKVNLGADVADKYPAEISGGMQKRVGLARAISTNPQILFFDEPTTGLDPITADVINDLIRDASTNLGASSLSITHDMASVRKIADRVAMLFEGEIIWDESVGLIDSGNNAHVDQFVHGRADGPIQIDAVKIKH